MTPSPGVTIAGLLGGHPESIGLAIEVVAGAAGLERAITSPHIQKTGLALAGFHEYLRPGRVLLLGTSPELTRHHMEIRGLGVINVRDIFGIASTRASKRVELVVQLERWDPAREYDRLGLEERSHEVLGLKVPLIQMPVAPGRNL